MKKEKTIEEKIKEIADRRKLHLTADGHLKGINPTPAEVAFLKAHKKEVENFLRERKKKREERMREKKERGEKIYQELIKKLPPIKYPETDGDLKQYEELIKKAENVKFYHGPEDDGLNLAQRRYREDLITEARKHCPHEWTVKYYKEFTGDARRQIRRVATCLRCGEQIVDIVSEEISDTARWR